MAASIAFVGYPAAVLVNDNREAVMQKLWGSFLPLTGKKDGDWLQVKMGDDRFWIHKNETQPEGIL